VLTVAVKTGIIDAVAKSPGNEDEIAGLLGLEPLPTGKIIRALAAMEIFVCEAGKYSLAPEVASQWGEAGDPRAMLMHHHLNCFLNSQPRRHHVACQESPSF